ncbi:uncharacterized protein G2W53_008211 [Senna tora]|uniref:Uncharacterized protein n=1 Tax=Senna tora TaxID=362788 RepID=A0A835CF03_9FABA|nr:uncharacterized protein G2W53_008211 [Senna tora]
MTARHERRAERREHPKSRNLRTKKKAREDSEKHSQTLSSATFFNSVGG